MPHQKVIWMMQVSGPLARIPQVRLRSGVTTLASIWGLQVCCQDYLSPLLMFLACLLCQALLRCMHNRMLPPGGCASYTASGKMQFLITG